MTNQNSAKVSWTGERLDFRGSVGSGYHFDISSGSEKIGAGPMELILAGVAGCTAADVVSILKKQRQEVDEVEVEVIGRRADEHPKVYTELTMNYVVRGKEIDPNAVRRAIDLSQEKYCSASAILARSGAKMATNFVIEDLDPK